MPTLRLYWQVAQPDYSLTSGFRGAWDDTTTLPGGVTVKMATGKSGSATYNQVTLNTTAAYDWLFFPSSYVIPSSIRRGRRSLRGHRGQLVGAQDRQRLPAGDRSEAAAA